MQIRIHLFFIDFSCNGVLPWLIHVMLFQILVALEVVRRLLIFSLDKPHQTSRIMPKILITPNIKIKILMSTYMACQKATDWYTE